MKKYKELSKQNGFNKYIKIDKKILTAIQKIFEDFPDNEKNCDTPTKWINEILEWYIRTMFTNGDNYLDRQ